MIGAEQCTSTTGERYIDSIENQVLLQRKKGKYFFLHVIVLVTAANSGFAMACQCPFSPYPSLLAELWPGLWPSVGYLLWYF